MDLKRLHQQPNHWDIIFLFAFVLIITCQPFFLHGEINIFELGLYLPGINSVLHGGVPFRDFFHLRGPFEVYMPAGLMMLFGAKISVLEAYFYIGTVLTLLVSILIGKELYRTRYVLYLMTLILIARTFPRVVFTYWGGMRYVWGLMALLCAVRYFKRERYVWIFLSGIASSCAFFTSIEVGVCSMVGVFSALIFSAVLRANRRAARLRAFGSYCGGLALIGIPYMLYLIMAGAFVHYWESIFIVLTRMEKTFNPHLISGSPPNFFAAIPYMFNIFSHHFKHVTPFYFFILAGIFLTFHIKKNGVTPLHEGFVCILAYAAVMYSSAFRSIGSAQFEMALQPEKILLFFIVERAYFFFRRKRSQIFQRTKSYFPRNRASLKDCLKLYGILFLLVGFFGSSVGYSFLRYTKRFVAFQLLTNRVAGKHDKILNVLVRSHNRLLNLQRGDGMVVPVEQAGELESVVNFIQKNTKEGEIVFTYPDLGTYSFLANRPFLGRFPCATFSWFHDKWHDELVADFNREKPRFVVVSQDMDEDKKTVYFDKEGNREKYNDIMLLIEHNYNLEKVTPLSYIYKIKKGAWVDVAASQKKES